jgi:hypothetical protein
MNNSPISLDELRQLISSVHETLQFESYQMLDEDLKYRIVSSFIQGKFDPFLYENKLPLDSELRLKKDSLIKKLVKESQSFLVEDKNLRLLDVTNTLIGCENTDIYKNKDGNVINIDDDDLVTLSQKIAFSKSSFQRGSCITCTKDLNISDDYNRISVLKSKYAKKPGCVFYPERVGRTPEIQIHFRIRMINEDVFISDLSLKSSFPMKQQVINRLKKIFPSDSKLIKLTEVSWSIDADLPSSKIIISGMRITQRENVGAFTSMKRKGFEPLFEPESVTTYMGLPKIIHILQEILSVVCSSWNPLRFSNVSDLFAKPKKILGKYELEEKIPLDCQVSRYYWPVIKVSLHPSTLKNLISSSQAANMIKPSLTINQFSEDTDVALGSAELYLDKITFWTC